MRHLLIIDHNMEIENGRIESTMLGVEDHGIFTCVLHISFNGSGQGFGTACLDSYDTVKKKRIGTRWGLEYIMRLMEAVGVDKWEDLQGKFVRVKRVNGLLVSIGHIVKDQWFTPKELAKELHIK